MGEVIDLCCDSSDSEAVSSDYPLPPKVVGSLGVSYQVTEKRRSYFEDEDDDENSSVVDLTGEAKRGSESDESDFESAMRSVVKDTEAPKKKKPKLTETEKARRAEIRKQVRLRKKIKKQAEEAAIMTARDQVETAEASLCLEYSSCFAAAWPSVLELLESRGFKLARPIPGSNMIVTWRVSTSKKSVRRGILFIDAIKCPAQNLRNVLDQAHLPLRDMTLALIGPERARAAPDIAYLERKLTVRCLQIPRSGQGPEAKYTAKIVELLTTYAAVLVKSVRNQFGDRSLVALDDDNLPPPPHALLPDLWNGLAVKDLQEWTGAKPKTNSEAYLYLLRVLVPNHAADAVAAAFPTYALLYDALLSRGPAALANLTLNTPKRQRLGSACASKLHLQLTSTNPDLIV